MCTLTWAVHPGGYQVFFNRDELRTRAPARAPAAFEREGIRYVAPQDGDFGGSWILANELGLTLCLLNGYRERPDRDGAGFTSRGLLLLSLAASSSPADAADRLRKLDLSRYRTFLLVGFATDGERRLMRWDSASLAIDELEENRQPLVSSSFDTEEVRRSRAEHYRRRAARGAGDPTELHLAFHESHDPERGPYSTCMHRPDARTVSFSHVHVDEDTIRFGYAPHSPCRGRPTSEPVALDRATIELGGAP